MERWCMIGTRQDHNFQIFAEYYLNVYRKLNNETNKIPNLNWVCISDLERLLVPYIQVPFCSYFKHEIEEPVQPQESASAISIRLLNERIASKDALADDPNLFITDTYVKRIVKRNVEFENDPKALKRTQKLLSKLELLDESDNFDFIKWHVLAQDKD
jgi:hypothetical protein